MIGMVKTYFMVGKIKMTILCSLKYIKHILQYHVKNMAVLNDYINHVPS